MEFAFTDLLNSDWHDYRGSGRTEDRLERPGFVEGFLKAWGLPQPTPIEQPQREALRSLRTLLRRMTEAVIAGGEPSPDDISALNSVLAAAPETRVLMRTGREVFGRPGADDQGHGAGESVAKGYELRRVPLTEGWEAVTAAIAASFADVLANRDPRRLRICENPDCGWFFYDESHGHTRRWCQDDTCGNLMKVRRFRARNRKR